MSHEDLRDSIVEFLTSLSHQKEIARCRCGAEMEPQNVTFFYDGQSWNVVIYACRKCHPVPPSLPTNEM